MDRFRFAVCAAASTFAIACAAAPPTVESERDERARVEKLFGDVDEAALDLSPIERTARGQRKDQDRWDELTEANLDARAALARDALARAAQIDRTRLDPATRLSLDIFEYDQRTTLELDAFRALRYPATQLFAVYTSAPSLLLNLQRVESAADARDYVRRVERLPKLIDQLAERIRDRATRGTVPPRFVFAKMLANLDRVVAGRPFAEAAEDSALWADAQDKLRQAPLTTDERTALQSAVRRALIDGVKPAYARLRNAIVDMQGRATDDAGVWKLPDGDRYYSALVRINTTLDTSAEVVHARGLAETARLHREIRRLLPRLGIERRPDQPLTRTFERIRNDPAQTLPATPEGRAEYLDRARVAVAVMQKRLPEAFGVLPHASLEVREVEDFRSAGSAAAFYEPPTPDGRRPGRFYANTLQIETLPKFEIETLVHHEGIPGHHLQNAIAIENTALPEFRRHLFYSAYGEGWALYAERLPKEMGGFYRDPWQEFGRLNSELFRAARLVVDTGLHAKRWTREQAIAWMRENTALPEHDIEGEVERYCVWPGQALTYMTGMLKIVELREHARRALGREFDLREFHDVVLSGGAMPLTLLSREVDRWIEQRRAALRAGPARKPARTVNAG